MIVNSKKEKSIIIIKSITFILKELLLDIRKIKMIKKLVHDSSELDRLFRSRYPELIYDDKGLNKCTSCLLCVTSCPTSALEIKKANMVNFPESLIQGESPKDFLLDITKCIKCDDCAYICPTNALKLSENYQGEDQIVNLVKA